MERSLIYQREFIIHTYEIDFRGLVRVSSLLNYLQEVAGGQAVELGFSVEDLSPRGLTWVLSRYHICLQHYPRLGEKISLFTWPSGRSEFHALRDYEACDAMGSKFLAATSSWMVISLSHQQPVSVQSLYPENLILPRRAAADDFSSLPVPTSWDHEFEFPVEMSHLDLNRHVNNVVYVQWALEAAPPEILLHYSPTEVEISYRAAAVYGDRVISRVYLADKEKKELWHQIVRSRDDRELARLRTRRLAVEDLSRKK